MTTEEQQALDQWFDAAIATQPPDTIALLLYHRDGQVTLGRRGVDVEMREFDLHNIPQVFELVTAALGELYDKGVPDAPDAE
jgi:hypothetical protein